MNTDKNAAERRHDRHQGHREETWNVFLKGVVAVTGVSDWEAEALAVAALCALEQRLEAVEARHLEAQLPAELRERLAGCAKYEKDPPRSIDKVELLQMVARNTQREDWETEPLVAAVFAVTRAHLTPGLVTHVATQLPDELRAFWLGEGQPPVSVERFQAHDDQAKHGDYAPTEGPKTSPSASANQPRIPGDRGTEPGLDTTD